MLHELFATLVLMIMGGGVAYLGDFLGLKLGKKRLSLFGFRPRTTASLLSVGAGALTALLTFVVLLGLDSGFRIALRHGAQLVESNYRLNRDNHSLRAQSAKAQAAADQAQATAAQSQAAADQATQDARQAHAGVAAASAQLAKANTQLRVSRANLVTEQAAVTAAKGQLGSVQSQLATTRIALGAAQSQVAQARERSSALEASIAQDRKIARLYGQIGDTQFHNSLLYYKGQEVGRTSIAAGQSVASTRDQISLFLAQLSAQALSRGASRGSNGHAIQLPTVAFVAQAAAPGAPPPIFTGEQDNLNALAESIHSYTAGTSVALIARASGNSFAGQTVTVTLSPYSDRRILAAGDVLAQVTLQPSDRSYDGISEGLIQLLQAARRKAIRQGVIPVEINPSTHEAQLGDVTFSTLYGIVDQVRRMPAASPVTVTASAAADTWSIDQLRLSFTVGGNQASGEDTPARIFAAAGSAAAEGH